MVYGNLTRDPELKTMPSGTQVASFSIATNRKYKDKDGNMQEQVEFHNIIVFDKQAETSAQYLKKGSSAYVEGRNQTRSWDKDGVKMYRTEIVADRVQFGPRPKTEEAAPAPVASAPAQTAAVEPDPAVPAPAYPDEDIDPNDIPF